MTERIPELDMIAEGGPTSAVARSRSRSLMSTNGHHEAPRGAAMVDFADGLQISDMVSEGGRTRPITTVRLQDL